MIFTIVNLVRLVLNAFRKPECIGKPMTMDEANEIIKQRAAKHPEAASLNVEASVVDVCKALGLDGSMEARKRYAEELDFPGSYDGSAHANRWLRDKLVMKAAENDV